MMSDQTDMETGQGAPQSVTTPCLKRCPCCLCQKDPARGLSMACPLVISSPIFNGDGSEHDTVLEVCPGTGVFSWFSSQLLVWCPGANSKSTVMDEWIFASPTRTGPHARARIRRFLSFRHASPRRVVVMGLAPKRTCRAL